MPDGTIIRGVPDGMSRAELSAKLSANGMTIGDDLAAPSKQPGPKDVLTGWRDAGLGALSGAGRIGSTLVELGRTGPRGESLGTLLDRIKARHTDVVGGTRALGADPGALAFKTGDIAAQVAGTGGVGPALGKGAAALGASRIAPALTSGGFTTGMTGAPGLAARVGAGATTGAATAALVDPENAGLGAAIGGGLPVVTQAAGAIGRSIGGRFGAPAQTAEQAAAIQQARNAGYVIPPSQAKPTPMNRILEGVSGKITTAQNASARNQEVTNRLAAAAVGLPADQPITAEALRAVREQAGRAYAQLGSTGVVKPGPEYAKALDKIAEPYKLTAGAFPNATPSPVLQLVESMRSPAFASASAVEKIKQLRTAADDAYRTGNTDIGRASKAAAQALEDAVESHLTQIQAPDLLASFRQARQLIAKTYSVERAMNPATGTIDARKLSAQLAKGKPLSGDLKTAALFAGRFPKAAQTIEGMGSLPQTSPLDWVAALTGSAATGNPLPMAGLAVRPASRSMVLSPMVQDRLINGQGAGLFQLPDPVLRSAPLIAVDQ